MVISSPGLLSGLPPVKSNNNKYFSPKSSKSEAAVSYQEATGLSGVDYEDQGVIQQVLGGEVEAFAILVERYRSPVYNFCGRLLANSDEAEDAAQEVFWRAYSHLTTFQRGKRFSSWLFSIAAHHCIDLLRMRRPITGLDSLIFWKANGEFEPEAQLVEYEKRDEVRSLLKKLPAKYRAVVILRYWQDLRYEEIAHITDLSLATVKTRLFRARKLLAAELKKDSGLENQQ